MAVQKAPAPEKGRRGFRSERPVEFPYSTGTRHRWWKDQETSRLADALALRHASAYLTPIVRLALRYLEANPPTPSQIQWIRDNSRRQVDCQMTSWNGQSDELSIIRRVAKQHNLSHLDVHRLAIRLLAMAEGMVEPF